MKFFFKLVFISIYFLINYFAVVGYLHERSFSQNKTESTGKVIKVEKRGDGLFNPIFEYTYQGTRYEFMSDFAKEESFYQIGKSYDIFINSKEPKKAVLQKEKYGYKTTWEEYLALPTLILINVCMLLMLISKSFRQLINSVFDILLLPFSPLSHNKL